MSEWRPIETAPKDGTMILGFNVRDNNGYGLLEESEFPYVVVWDRRREAWIEAAGEQYHQFFPIRWMPLPEPPK